MFGKENIGDLTLTILFILYLVLGFNMPSAIANIVDSIVGKIAIVCTVLYLFMHCHPVVSVLALFVAFDLMRRSSATTGMDVLHNYLPCEEKKNSQFTAFNQFPYTLEQEVVAKMAPIVKSDFLLNKATYKPTLNNLHGAEKVGESQTILPMNE